MVATTVWIVVAIVGLSLMIIIILALAARRYVKVPPDQALVVYGRNYTILEKDPKSGQMRSVTRGYRIIAGGGKFITPVLNEYKFMSLETNTLEVQVNQVITKEGVPLTCDGVAQVKIRNEPTSLATAAEQLLHKTEQEIQYIATKTLEGHIRGVCATLAVEAINSNRDALSQKIQESAVPDLENMGMQIITFVIRDIKDEVGYLEALGKKRTAEVKKDAEVGEAAALREQTIKVAQAQKDGEIGKAEATRDQIIFVAKASRDGAVEKAKRDAEIADAERERDIKIAGYAGEVKKKQAERDLAYDITSNVQRQSLVKEQVQVEIEQRIKQVQLKDQDIKLAEKQEIAEKVVPAQKSADAMAAIADGEARKITIIANGEKSRITALGEGEAAKIEVLARAESNKIKWTGDAEASKVAAVGGAEAEAMRKKADSWKLYGDAAKAQMIVDKLPQLAEAMAKPLMGTEKIIIMGDGGPATLVQSTAKALATLPPVVESLTGMNLGDFIKSTSEAMKPAAK